MRGSCVSDWCSFFLGLTVATILFGIARSLLVFYVLVNSSQTLHNKMFESILKAPVLFFDRNPIGKSDATFLSILLTHRDLVTLQSLKKEVSPGENCCVCSFIFYEKLH